jgi:hypothetical protein
MQVSGGVRSRAACQKDSALSSSAPRYTRRVRRGLLVILLSFGCGDSTRIADIASGHIAAGSKVTVRGSVSALTFTSIPSPGGWLPTADRYLLLAPESDAQLSPSQRSWGVGVRLSPASTYPQIGDTVQVSGTISTLTPTPRPILLPQGEIKITSRAATALVPLGGPCQVDLDCEDALFCGRGGQCAQPPAGIQWNGTIRNIYGSCATDDDCPTGERCDAGYTISSSGAYAPTYFGARDAGRHLCQVASRTAAAQPLCRRVAAIADYLGGRFPEGKEICVRGLLWATAQAEDGDTHVQLKVADASIFPESSPGLDLFGATTENAPPYKDPQNPIGALLSPAVGADLLAVGTVHWDDGHGWWEIHPAKLYRAP